MSIWVKAGLATLGAGAIGGVGAYAGGLFDSKKPETNQNTPIKLVNISNKLKDEGFEALDTNTDTGWQDVLTEYQKSNQKIFPTTITITSIQHLKAQCERLKNENSEITTNYSLAKQWCVKKQKITEILKNNKKFKFLEETEAGQWTTKINNLKGKTEIIAALEITKTSGKELVNNDLVEKCKEIGNLETTDNNFLTKFELAKTWCSVPKN